MSLISRRRHAAKRLLVTAGVVVIVVMVVFLLYDSQVDRTGFVTDRSDWPPPLARLCTGDERLASKTSVYEVDAFVDHKSLWRISQREFADQLIDKENLEPVTCDHVLVKELYACLPAAWKLADPSAYETFASTGYGTTHQEGVDLFLVLRPRGGQVCYVMYEWIF